MKLQELLAGAVMGVDEDEEDDFKPGVPNDVAIKTLRELTDRYTGGCPFHVGQIVTPRAGSNTKGVGMPHVVLEVIEPVLDLRPAADYNSYSSHFGRRLDIRVGTIKKNPRGTDSIVMFWGESFEYEVFTGEPEAGKPN